MTRQLLVTGATAALLSVGVARSEPEYSVQGLGPIGYRHQTWSINQNGQVVGYSEEAEGRTVAPGVCFGRIPDMRQSVRVLRVR